jgi:hypothetical protein
MYLSRPIILLHLNLLRETYAYAQALFVIDSIIPKVDNGW